MKIAISGKGGSGKTTIAGTLARYFAKEGLPVLAIDGDINPCLDLALGLIPGSFQKPAGLPHHLVNEVTDENGNSHPVLSISLQEAFEKYGIDAMRGIRLLTLEEKEHAGDG